jgi:general secretion pathway protein L
LQLSFARQSGYGLGWSLNSALPPADIGNSLLSEFLTWWRQQLLDIVPERLRQSGRGGANAMIVDAGVPGFLTLHRRRRGQESRFGQMRLDEPGDVSLRAALNGRPAGEPVLLRPAASAVLERAVRLPLAAERDPERVLGYDMERLTPFTADEVFWGYAVESRDKARGQLGVRVALVPRGAVADLIEKLTSCGGRPDLIEAPTTRGMRTIRLSHNDAARSRLTTGTALAVLGALAVLVIVSPFIRQSLAMGAAQSQLADLAPQVKLAEQLRARASGAGTGGDAVASEMRRLGDMLEALSAITEILPDDSYLTEFTMRERKMTLSGQSASAPKLISALSTDPRVKGPAFTAPVTKGSNGKEVFAIKAELAD